MSYSTTISALVSYPLLYLLPLNLVRIRWGFEKGLTPMPPEVEEKAEAADRLAVCITHVVLLVVVVLLMSGSPISAYEVGFTADNWKPALGMGVLLSLFPLGLITLLLRNIPPGVREEPESRGPIATWFGVITLGSFAHEFWRAFCIVSLIRLGFPAWVAVLIVAVAYGALQLQTSIARTLGAAAFGGVAGFLFVATGSLLSPLTMSLIVAGVHLYQLRQQGIHHPQSRYSRPCPVCGASIRPSEGHRAGEFLACPNCGEPLTIEKKNLWVVGALSIVTAFYATRHLIYRDPGYILLAEGLALVLFFVGAFLLGLFVPPKYKPVRGKAFDKTLSLFGAGKSDIKYNSQGKS